MKQLIIATLGLGLLAFGGTAVASNCTIKLKGDDRMQFDQKEITVSAACKTISIELEHTGKLPAAAMGHNVVVSATPDVQAINTAGAKAGAAAGYLPQGDAKVLAATDMIGGGASTKASFAGSKLKAGGDYTFFCSFPGHAALMKGKLVVTP
ncbi:MULTISPECIES: azurin [unclassified Luteimonas]|uniref:azurin n=1 Tax=unclassified Luteimonas TaxID=2629088 RepID=UPI0018F0AC35|nr:MULTISPECIES: azurin [unclassified Luteimonas]MBJ6977853.1 azurin [Luteimonas sp. MC1895]MBJ6984672.1 azurin [Luteimonas sp. MC1750]QQO04730.1 azurin [Luteimonas sp. MC1750]